jgi:beta-glucosidase
MVNSFFYRSVAAFFGLLLFGSVNHAQTQLPASGPVPSLTQTKNSAIIPRSRDDQWLKRHQEFLGEIKTNRINLLFLGDSITDFWRSRGSNVWNEYYAPRHAANLGINGDRTQNLLWRLQNGELDGLHPKVVILMIGTNNTGKERNKDKIRNTTSETIEGVHAVVHAVQTRLPDSRILLLGIFPRGEPGNPQRQQIQEINQAIASLADGRRIVFLDIGGKFLSPDGRIAKDIMSDLLHPTEKGYRIWAEAMEPTLSAMLAPQKPPLHGRIVAYQTAR